MTTATVFDPRLCQLGEGPLWHPARGQLYWFDIVNRQLLTREGEAALAWDFAGHVSAAGWIDRDTLLVASETALHRFELTTGKAETLCPLEADDPRTRSNDGRADPWGGFWIGTMGKAHETGIGAFYRYYRGELRQLYSPITIPNATCFAPDGGHAYFADSGDARVRRVRLDGQGWPVGEPEVFLDLAPEGLVPDGAVTDAAGNLWLAEWGAGRVCCYAPDGTRQRVIAVPALQTTCPAFGGADLSTLYITSAAVALPEDELRTRPDNGATFIVEGFGPGTPEPQVIL